MVRKLVLEHVFGPVKFAEKEDFVPDEGVTGMLENINLKLEDFEEAYSRVSPGKFLNYQDCKLKKDTWGNDEYIGMILKKEEKNINGEPNWHGFKQGY